MIFGSGGDGDVAVVAPPLPAEIAFLARHGLPVAMLQEAAARARRLGLSAEEALLRTGLATPDELYRALAAELGLPFLEAGFDVHPLTRVNAALSAGLAPLAGPVSGARYAFAPSGPAWRDLLDRGGRIAAGIGIATPAAVRESVFAGRGEAIAREAAWGLARLRPDDSFHGGPTQRQVLAVYAFLLATGAALLFAPTVGWLLLACGFGLPFVALVVLKLAALIDRAPATVPPPARRRDRDLPIYTILVPLHRERRILPQLLAGLSALDYPPAKRDIKLLIEADDAETRQALGAFQLPPDVEIVLVPPGLPRTKPRALNVGLVLARGEFLVVYDAEDVPDPQQLRLAVAAFAAAPPEVACFQARLVIDNVADTWLTRFFAVEYAALFDILNPALARLELPVLLGGTSNHLRTGLLRDLGGWDPWNVTEDADLGVRLARAGYRVGDLPSATFEEAPRHLSAWMAQRTRWMKGYLQVVITHARRPLRALRELGPLGFTATIALTYGAVLSCLVYPVFVTLALADILGGRFLEVHGLADVVTGAVALTLLVCGPPAIILPALVVLTRRGLRPLWPFALLMPAYLVLVSVAAWRGLWELVRAPHRWNKTEHGLARTSWSGAERLKAAAPAPSLPPPADAPR